VTMGALTWAAGYLGWLPRAGLTRPVLRERPSRTAASLLGHMACGLLAAAPICAAEIRYRARRTPWLARWAFTRVL
jgi:hypothetical protein